MTGWWMVATTGTPRAHVQQAGSEALVVVHDVVVPGERLALKRRATRREKVSGSGKPPSAVRAYSATLIGSRSSRQVGRRSSACSFHRSRLGTFTRRTPSASSGYGGPLQTSTWCPSACSSWLSSRT